MSGIHSFSVFCCPCSSISIKFSIQRKEKNVKEIVESYGIAKEIGKIDWQPATLWQVGIFSTRHR